MPPMALLREGTLGTVHEPDRFGVDVPEDDGVSFSS
jgi:hypothetical protein